MSSQIEWKTGDHYKVVATGKIWKIRGTGVFTSRGRPGFQISRPDGTETGIKPVVTHESGLACKEIIPVRFQPGEHYADYGGTFKYEVLKRDEDMVRVMFYDTTDDCIYADGRTDKFNVQGELREVLTGFILPHSPSDTEPDPPAAAAVGPCKCNLHQLMRGEGHDEGCNDRVKNA